ncbi:RING finger 32 isoform X1 [Labeo rohita]|uniref:RING finger 32 isoform X1 n=1 Tax=Labeo rohita TaxID=84645 RepID=A0A498MK41_LABRO|nr:RING finger 32 isoform X1 [Labeo rohita]
MRDVESGTSEKNVNTPLSSALDLPFPFPDTWMGPMVQHGNVRQNYQPIEAVKAQGIFLPPASIVHNAPFDIWSTERQLFLTSQNDLFETPELMVQVLLSCSHVFHKVCLKSFEKFSGRKSCPMCRTEQYETRVIYDGARLYREKCAVRIQAFWRGYLVRKWYSNVKKYVPPKDQQLRRRFFEKKFQEMNDSLVQSCSMDVEAFLSDIDRSVATSHHILRRFADKYAGASEMEDKDWLEAQEKDFSSLEYPP